jgi:hypothetical protein
MQRALRVARFEFRASNALDIVLEPPAANDVESTSCGTPDSKSTARAGASEAVVRQRPEWELRSVAL